MSRSFGWCHWLSLPAMLVALAVVAAGCTKTAPDSTSDGAPPVSIGELEAAHDHAHHAHADNYPEAVAELEKLNAEIAAASTAGNIDDAHDALHEVPPVVGGLVQLAKDAGLNDAAVAEVSSAVESLMDAFEGVDALLHGGQGKGYDEVKADVDAAMAVLRGHVPQ